jgi:hypothetical protein
MAQSANPFQPLVRDIVREVLAEMETKQPATRRLLNLADAALYLSCSEKTVKNHVASGDLRRVRLHRNFLFDIKDLDALIQASK